MSVAGGRRLTSAARVEAVTLQLHPGWPYRGVKVVEAMAADGSYRSQLETGTSDGGRTAFPGGDRWRWESRLLSGRYDRGPAVARPVYGAWNRRADPYGGPTRFGSSYLRLRPAAVDRSTFCPGLRHELDTCVEAQVHGPVRLDTDVEALVLDPCFAGTDVVVLARSLGDEITPDVIGDATRAGLHPAQSLEQVWHCPARFGRLTS